MLVGLDPGHGGKNVGCVSKYNPNFLEKTATLDTATRFASALQLFGFGIAVSRAGDQVKTFKKRAEQLQDADVVLSFHFNSAVDATLYGSSFFVDPNDSLGMQLANYLAGAWPAALLGNARTVVEVPDQLPRGHWKTNARNVIKEHTRPMVLCELLFMSHERTVRSMFTSSGLLNEAALAGIVGGVVTGLWQWANHV